MSLRLIIEDDDGEAYEVELSDCVLAEGSEEEEEESEEEEEEEEESGDDEGDEVQVGVGDRVKAKNKDAFEGRKQLSIEDLAKGQKLKVTREIATGKITKIRILG